MKICTLASGSAGNSIYVEGEEASVLVDAGLSGRAIAGGLESIGVDPSALDAILITHEHKDHITGAGVLARRYGLKVFATEATWEQMDSMIGKVPDYNRCVLEQGQALEVADLQVEHFAASHDAADPVGFCFYAKGGKVGLATDTGYLTREARRHIDGADLLVFEANHDLEMLRSGRYPWSLKKRILSDRGHLSNIAAGHCLASLTTGQTKAVVLAHLSQENNLPELAYSTVAKCLTEAGLDVGADLALEVAPRYHPGTLWQLNE